MKNKKLYTKTLEKFNLKEKIDQIKISLSDLDRTGWTLDFMEQDHKDYLKDYLDEYLGNKFDGLDVWDIEVLEKLKEHLETIKDDINDIDDDEFDYYDYDDFFNDLDTELYSFYYNAVYDHLSSLIDKEEKEKEVFEKDFREKAQEIFYYNNLCSSCYPNSKNYIEGTVYLYNNELYSEHSQYECNERFHCLSRYEKIHTLDTLYEEYDIDFERDNLNIEVLDEKLFNENFQELKKIISKNNL